MEPGQPSRTAFGAAGHRAAHQDLENGWIFRDPLAWKIMGIEREAVLERANEPGRRMLRLFIAIRHRFAEDALADAVARGTDQAVVLGAGLDTFAYRNPHRGLRVFEVDHPATAEWKQGRLADAGIEVPGGVGYIGVDFETDDLRTRLVEGGVDLARPVFFMWLGVVPYLSLEAISATLTVIAGIPGGEVVFDYSGGRTGLTGPVAAMREALAARVASIGEPFRSAFEPAEVERLLRGAGFDEIEDLGRDDFAVRYLGVRPATPASGGGGHVVRARRTSLD